MSNKRTWLIDARRKKKLTQDEVARIVGTTTGAISHYELGNRNPKPATAIKLANLLHVSKERFYFAD